MTIKERIKQEIINRETLEKGLRKLRFVFEDDTDALSILARFSNYDRESHSGRLSHEYDSIQLSQINYSAITLANQIPEDSELFRIYLSKLDLSRACILLLQCLKDSDYFKDQLEQFEDNDEAVKNLIKRGLFNGQFQLVDNWQIILWEDLSYDTSLLDPRYSVDSHKEGNYLNNILKLKKSENDKRGKFDLFILWSELYATKDYAAAYQTALELRNQYPSRYPSYEYLFLSFTHKHKSYLEEKKPEAWVLSDTEDYNKLKVYVDYANELYPESITLADSKRVVGEILLNELEILYDQISYDYVVRNATRSTTQKRELVIKIIKSCWQVREDFEIKSNYRIFERLLIELLGGAKFRWMNLGENGVANINGFDGKNYLEKGRELLFEQDESNIEKIVTALKNSLQYKITSLLITRNKRTKQQELRNTCCLIDNFFPGNDFLELAKTISKEKMIQEEPFISEDEDSQLFSEKNAFAFSDKVIKDQFLEEKVDGQPIDSEEIQILSEDSIPNNEQEDSNLQLESIQTDIKFHESDNKYIPSYIPEEKDKSQDNFIRGTQEKTSIEIPKNTRIINAIKNIFSRLSKVFLFLTFIKLSIFIIGSISIYYLREDIIAVGLVCLFLILVVIIRE